MEFMTITAQLFVNCVAGGIHFVSGQLFLKSVP